MKSVLYQLYEGALCPLASQRPQIKEQQQLLERQYQQYIYMENELEKLNPALKTSFMEMVDSLFQEIFWNNAQVFIDGFCLATKIMAEVYQTQPAAKEKA